jgi:hypothetical protein
MFYLISNVGGSIIGNQAFEIIPDDAMSSCVKIHLLLEEGLLIEFGIIKLQIAFLLTKS